MGAPASKIVDCASRSVSLRGSPVMDGHLGRRPVGVWVLVVAAVGGATLMWCRATSALPAPVPVMVWAPPNAVLAYQSEAPALEGAAVIVYRRGVVSVGYDHFFVSRRTVARIAAEQQAVARLALSNLDEPWAPGRYDRQLSWWDRRSRRREPVFLQLRGTDQCYGRAECRRARRGSAPALTRLVRDVDRLARRLEASRGPA
jgi:hypothetical protein